MSPVDSTCPTGILLVDDEVDIIEILEESISGEGFRVFTAPDAKKALEIYEHSADDIQIMVTDQGMPGMTGIQLGGLIRQKKKIPVILASGAWGVELEEAARENGIEYRIQKPFLEEDLLKVIHFALEHEKEKARSLSP